MSLGNIYRYVNAQGVIASISADDLNFRGDYEADRSYVPRDVVDYGGDQYMALSSTTNHAPPTDISRNGYWTGLILVQRSTPSHRTVQFNAYGTDARVPMQITGAPSAEFKVIEITDMQVSVTEDTNISIYEQDGTTALFGPHRVVTGSTPLPGLKANTAGKYLTLGTSGTAVVNSFALYRSV